MSQNSNQNDPIFLVQSTFEKVAPIAETASELFYGRLFELSPEIKELFQNTNMETQGRMLMEMLGTAVRGLKNLEELKPAVRDLGKRHVNYGVKPEHYPVVGAALLWALEQGLGNDFTPEVKEAWAGVYDVLAKLMQEGAGNIADAA